MNFKTTLVLLLLLMGAAGVYLARPGGVASFPWGGPDAAPPLSTALVTGTDFRALLIERDGPRVELRRDDAGRWWQLQPVRFPLADQAVQGLVNTALALSPIQAVEPQRRGGPSGRSGGETLATMGLEPPVAKATYVSDAGVQTLHLGRTTVAGTAYVQVADPSAEAPNGGPVYLVDSSLHTALLKPSPRDWWPRTLPTLRPDRVATMEVHSKGLRLELHRTAEGWSLSGNGNQRADPEKAAATVAIFEGVEIGRYVSEGTPDPTRFGLDKPTHVVTLTDADGRTQTLRLGGNADLSGQTIYANWTDGPELSPVVFTLPAAVRSGLPTSVDELRDPRLVLAQPDKVRGQRVNRIGRDQLEVALRSDASGFAFVQPNPGYAPDNALSQAWLLTLPTARATAFSQAPREAQAPLATVELQLAGGRSESVGIYENRDGLDGTVLVVRGHEPVAAVVPSEVVAPLLAPIITLRDRTLPTASSADAIDTVRLSRDDGTEFRFERASGDAPWTLAGEGPHWDRARFASLLAWLQAPTVAQWAPMTELPRGPMARLTLGGNQPVYTVNLDQGLGQRTDLPGVFRLNPDVMGLVRAEYRDRLVVAASAGSFSRVVLERDGEERVIERSVDRRYTATPPPAGGLEASAAARLFDTLAGLRGERVVSEAQAGLMPEAQPLRVHLENDGSKPTVLELFDPSTNRGQRWLIRSAGGDRFYELTKNQGLAIGALAPGSDGQ